jgi:hypothetical protein
MIRDRIKQKTIYARTLPIHSHILHGSQPCAVLQKYNLGLLKLTVLFGTVNTTNRRNLIEGGEFCVMEYNAVESQQTFRRNVSPPFVRIDV